jgi:hypothetical protein
MGLTGKCKEDFEVWFEREYSHCAIYDYWINEDLGISMQYGVYVDYLDSVGIVIEIYNTIHGFDIMINTNIFRGYFKTRQEAREQAIIKANEIYNKKLDL